MTLPAHPYLYDFNNPSAYYAKSGCKGERILTPPRVQLTVGCNTTLLLNVTRDFSSTRHSFMFRLLRRGSPVCRRNITLTLNSTVYSSKQYGSLRTNNAGYAWVSLYLTAPAGGNQTYNVVASFSGDPASTATATLTTINGTSYDVCSTTQYNSYEPCSNSTAITVEPQTTIGATTLMNTARMQADAKSKGWLSIYNQFSWWYPWYRLHVKVSISSFMVDVGFNPVLPSGVTISSNGLNVFSPLMKDVFEDVGLDLVSLFAQYLVAKYAAGMLNFVLALAVEFAKAAARGALLFGQGWSDRMAALADAIESFVMGILALGNMGIAEGILKEVCGVLETSAGAAFQWVFNQLDNVLMVANFLSRTWVDALEVAIDFVLGGTALGHYFGWW